MKRLMLIAVVGCLMINNAWAEHEADHRYNIRGYVLDENQRGIRDLNVQAFDGNNLLASSKTDADGYYSLHLHLHNEDYHRILRLRAGPHESELRVTFDRNDKSTLRVHEANFVAGKYIEGGLGHFRVPPWIYPAGGLLAIGIIVVYLESRRKKKIRKKKTVATEHHLPGQRKSKKKKGKKHKR